MTDLSEARTDIELEEVSFRSSVSEAVMQRIGQAVNFINRKQHQIHSFNYNGLTRLFVDTIGADGVFPCLFDMEIVGISVFQRKGGVSGNTIIDMEYFSAPNVNGGSIFSVKPQISSLGGDFNYLVYNALTDTEEEIGAGFTSPTFSKTQFDKGDVINCKIESATSESEDLMVMIHHRPR